MPAALTDSSQIICEVWASNVEDEMRKIRQIIQSYNFIAMVSQLHFDFPEASLVQSKESVVLGVYRSNVFFFFSRTRSSQVWLSDQSASSAAQWTTSTSC